MSGETKTTLSALGFGALAQARLDSIRYNKLSAEYPWKRGFQILGLSCPVFPRKRRFFEGNTDLLTPPEWLRAEVGKIFI